MSNESSQMFRRKAAAAAFVTFAFMASVASTAALTQFASDGGLPAVMLAANDVPADRSQG